MNPACCQRSTSKIAVAVAAPRELYMIKHPRCRRTSRQIVLFLSFCNKTMSSKVLDFQQQQQLLLIPLGNKRFAHVQRSISFWTFLSQQVASAAGPACFLACLLAVSAAAHLLQQHSSSNPSSLRFFEPVWQAFILRCLLHSHDSTNTCSVFTCRVIIIPGPASY